MEFGYRTNFSLYGNGVTEIIDCEVVSDGAPEPEFTYMGNGVVTFRLLTDEGESYTSEIVFTKKDNEIKYVRKDSMD